MAHQVKYDFSGHTVVVTGGAMGIGEATVRKFAEAGAAVAIESVDGAQTITDMNRCYESNWRKIRCE